jgi:putative nucleotidyltransferase with HDIG domain
LNLYVFIPLMWVFVCLILLAVLLIKGKKYVNGLPPRDKEVLKKSGIELLVPLKNKNRLSGILLLAGNSFRKPDSLEEQRILQRASSNMLGDIKSVKGEHQELYKTIEGVIDVVSNVMSSRDPYTASHQRRVAELARHIAKEIGFTDWQMNGVYVTGLVHDVGKVSVPTEILNKPGKINASEFNIIKNHCRVGYDILQKINFPWPVTTAVLQHHERLDGSGYPEGLTGDDIILETRILSVADVVEAMSSHRPYRPALGLDNALEEISRGSGTLYDSDVVTACLNLLRKNKADFDEIMAAAEVKPQYALEVTK